MSDNDGNNPAGESGAGPLSPLIHRVDLGVAVILLAFSGTAYYFTTSFEEVSPLLAQNVPPEWFPRLLIWTIVILTLVLPFEHRFLAKGRAGLDSDRNTPIPPMVFATAILLCLTVASIAWIGTLFTMIMVCLALPILWGERRWKVLIPFAIVFPLLVALLFTQGLKVYFEPGAFGLDLS